MSVKYIADEVITIADAEVGYLEKKTNSNLDSKTENAGSNNYTKYWRDLAPSSNGSAWCNCFVNWCFTKAFGATKAKEMLYSTGGWSYYTPTSASYFKNNKAWYSTPVKGDIIYYKNSTRICHVGIVYKVDSNYVYTIEGNTSGGNTLVANGGGVAKKKYALTYSAIAGYGRPKYSSTATSSTSKAPTIAQPTLKNGSSGVQAKLLQQDLNYLQFQGSNGKTLTVDGEIGTNTIYALKAFQKKYNLTVDGVYGTNSYNKMKTVCK
jgi:hypothetical protein